MDDRRNSLQVHSSRVVRETRLPTLSALIDDHVFSQQHALTGEQFKRNVELRGLYLPAPLEDLGRDDVLLPFYGIRYDADALIRRSAQAGTEISSDDIKRALEFTNTEGRGLLRELGVGDLFDPAMSPNSSWTETRVYDGLKYRTRRSVYSPYQLLGARELARSFRLGYRPNDSGWVELRDWAGRSQAWWRDVAVVLSALEAAFRPAIVPKLVGFDLDIGRWAEYHAEFDVKGCLDALGVDLAALVGYAEHMLSAAHSFDPLRDWKPLVDLVHQEHHAKLRGEALLAWEYRVAAETLLLAYEAAARAGDAEPLSPVEGRIWQPRHFRISGSREPLNQVLTEFGLSAHPSVLVVLEGEIEFEVLGAVLDSRLRTGWRNSISLQTMRGLNRDVSELASYVAPVLLADDGHWVRVARPVTHVVIVGDPETSFRTEDGREGVRQRWVDRTMGAIPTQWRTPVIREQLDRVIEVFVWSPRVESFEYSQFSDSQLARAIRTVSRSPDTPSESDLVSLVSNHRQHGWNLRRLWKDWQRPRPNKSNVVRFLLPELISAVNDELNDLADDRTSPVTSLVLRILQVSSSVRRTGHIVLAAGPTVDG